MWRSLHSNRAALTVFICSLTLGSVSVSQAHEGGLCEREMERAARRHNVPLAILYAVGLTETGRGGELGPYALNIEGASVSSATVAEAMTRFEAARQNGAKLIDVGCMQINHHFHGDKFESVAMMFDPRRNVDYAARFLRALKDREGDWTLAAARYHAGPGNVVAQKTYVCRVISNLVRSGFGAWTANAKSFCGASQ
ncbi:transglycosylase SLT domain-containing protein [Methylocella sp.]|uniref:transglycosylase SLT domain-containing protein n=1 Tax=Methylocella sp. TaxID=1978226 RepID=UPI0037832ADD